MSTSPITSASLHQQLETYFQARQSDLSQLGQALQSGDLSSAQQDYNSVVTLGQSGPFQNGDPFYVPQREADFNQIGQDLQSGNVAAAQQAFTALRNTFHQPPPPVTGTATTPANAETSAGTAAVDNALSILI